MARQDYFNARSTLNTDSGPVTIYRLDALEKAGVAPVSQLPFSIKVMLEAALRQAEGFEITQENVETIARWNAGGNPQVEIPFKPARVVLQDFTGVPSVVDLAALRSAMARMGGDPKKINPLVPVDLVIDHSVQVDRFGSIFALHFNAEREFERNIERYEFLNGPAGSTISAVVPSATGIVHQVNLEYLAGRADGQGQRHARSLSRLSRTDSHTTMINGLGAGLGVWAASKPGRHMLGQPIICSCPMWWASLTGSLPDGATATDLQQGTEMLVQQAWWANFVLRPGLTAEPARPGHHRQYGLPGICRAHHGLFPVTTRPCAIWWAQTDEALVIWGALRWASRASSARTTHRSPSTTARPLRAWLCRLAGPKASPGPHQSGRWDPREGYTTAFGGPKGGLRAAMGQRKCYGQFLKNTHLKWPRGMGGGRDILLHQHQQPVGDDGGSVGQESRGAGD